MGENPPAAIVAMSSSDPDVVNRAEWILVKAGPAVLPSVREALQSGNAQMRERCTQILAWQGDREALPMLRSIAQSHPEDRKLIEWAIEKINTRTFAF